MTLKKSALRQMIREALYEGGFVIPSDVQRPADKLVANNDPAYIKAKETFEQTVKDLVVELSNRFYTRQGQNSFVQKPYLDKDWTPAGVIKVIIEFTTTGSKECASLDYKDRIARWLREHPAVCRQGINVASRMTDDDSVFEYVLSCNVGTPDGAPEDRTNQLVRELVREELKQMRLVENGRGYSRDVWQIQDMAQFLDNLINNGNNQLRAQTLGELWEKAHTCKTCRYKSQCDVLYAETGERLTCAELMNIMVGESDVSR